MARTPRESTFDVLSLPATVFFADLQKHIEARSTDADASAREALACLDRLRGFLYQARDFRGRVSEACSIVPTSPSAMASSNEELCFSFEALLFQSRAALDRAARYVSHALHTQDSDRFSKLLNVLQTHAARDRRAGVARTFLSRMWPQFEGLVVDTEKRSLRSLLIHRKALSEVVDVSFTTHLLEDGRLFRFDCEVQGFALIRSGWMLQKCVPLAVLGLLSLFEEFRAPVEADLVPTWQNRTLCFSDYIDETNTGPRLSVIRLGPGGFKLVSRHLDPIVLEGAERLFPPQRGAQEEANGGHEETA